MLKNVLNLVCASVFALGALSPPTDREPQQSHYAIALSYEGVSEIPGPESDPFIMSFLQTYDPGARGDHIPWCSAFTGYVLQSAGYDISGTTLLARSWLDFGEPVSEAEAKQGDLAIFARGREPWMGHVAFVASVDETGIKVLGGNQRDAVSISTYGKDKVLGFRRPTREED